MSQNDVKRLIDMSIIEGKKVMVFECGRPPVNEYADADITAFAADVSPTRDVHYEAIDTTVEWFRSPFYVGRTAPTQDELVFQLRRWHSQRQMKFSIASVVGIMILYFLFDGYF